MGLCFFGPDTVDVSQGPQNILSPEAHSRLVLYYTPRVKEMTK